MIEEDIQVVSETKEVNDVEDDVEIFQGTSIGNIVEVALEAKV